MSACSGKKEGDVAEEDKRAWRPENPRDDSLRKLTRAKKRTPRLLVRGAAAGPVRLANYVLRRRIWLVVQLLRTYEANLRASEA